MKRKTKISLYLGIGALAAFAIWTVLVRTIDLQPAGPHGSYVGFATLNRAFHTLTGSNMLLYVITDWLGLVPIAVAFGFAILGLLQLIRRKSLLKVDHTILALGVFYIFVMIFYVAFEIVVINRRPVLIEGYLEASYPSSTTMLVLTVMPTAIIEINTRVKKTSSRLTVLISFSTFSAFMVIGRLICGVHWISDIIGGALLSLGLVATYCFARGLITKD